MYIVTVTFEVRPQYLDLFRAAIARQAANSLRLEPACRQFDVCWSPIRPELCFLYEKYDDQTAFDSHLSSQHFRSFDAAVQTWIASKQVQTWIEQPAL